MDKEEILKMCESILRDIHECDKVFLHVDRIKSIINKRVEPCLWCSTSTKLDNYCSACGRKIIK